MEAIKTIKNGTILRLPNWRGKMEVAEVSDLGIKEWYKDRVTDNDRLYASARTVFLTSDVSRYEDEDKRYSNTITVEHGEVVRLRENGKLYKVKCMSGYKDKRFEYLSDLLHFELIK